MKFRLLGPDGAAVDFGRPQQRLVLAIVLTEAGKLVSTATLIDHIWEEAPAGARRTLQVHITRLRRALRDHSGVSLIGRSGGSASSTPTTPEPQPR